MAIDDILASSAAVAPERAIAAAADPFAFIDLARCGRTDWWSGLKGLLKIVFWYVACSAAAIVPMVLWRNLLPFGALDVLALLAVAIGWPLGLRGALRSQRRPFLTLVSIDGRFSVRRCLFGAGLWLAVVSAGLVAWALVELAVSDDALSASVQGLSWPHGGALLATLGCLLLLPLQSAGEELVFRGWLTQTLGQALRSRPLLVLIVGIVFALAHGTLHGRYALLTYLVLSLGLSVVTLVDQRIEMAIGIHTANNLLAVLGSALTIESSGQPTLLFDSTQIPWWSPFGAGAQFLIVCAVVFWLARRRRRRALA
jgi:membrane protease YdiL (CAAX protease family)